MIERHAEVPGAARCLVSVVTVSFNSARTIERTLQSVVEQSHPEVEHLVIDGGSSDGTVDILRRYERPGFRWLSEPDNGMYDAMNKGMALAGGECIGILNSDDWLEPQALSDVAACFAAPECGYTYGDVYLASAAGERFGLMAAMDLDRMGLDYRYTMPFPHQSCYVRRRLIDALGGGYSTGYRLSSDHDFIVRLIESGAHGVKLPRPLATYRMGGASGGLRTFKESRDIAIRHGMPAARAYWMFVASLSKVALARTLPKSLVRVLMRLKRSRHVWY